MCFRVFKQRAKSLALERHHIFFRHQGAGIDVAAAHHIGDQAGNVEVVRADETAITHVDELALDGGHAIAARHGEGPFVRRAVA